MNFKNVLSIKKEKEHIILKFMHIKLKLKRSFKLSDKNLNIEKNKIVFSNYFGKSYGCNPKAITEEIIRQNLPYKIIWLVENPKKERVNFPAGVKLVNYYSKSAMKELLTAQVWVDNNRKYYFWKNGLIKKAGQKYIQTWHGSLGIKKMEGDIENENISWRDFAKIDSENIDYIIANSTFLEKLFKRESCFWYDGNVLKFGHPRNDIFFASDDMQENIKQKVYKKLGIRNDYLKILYVPTFRDDGDVDCLDIDFENTCKALERKFNKKCAFLVRLHPNVPESKKEKIFNDGVLDATCYPDIQELLLASDIVISDYSSCVFDFMLTKKPVFIYASDIEKYNTERGFYYSLTETPFPIAKNNKELILNIENFSLEFYNERVEKFLTDKGCIDDGNASKRTVELIKKIMEEDSFNA